MYFIIPFHVYLPCAAPASHPAQVLTSTDSREPTAKQQTTDPSPCQSKSLVFLPIICGTLLCCKASSCKSIHKARQIRFPVYRPCPHAILARLPNFHFSLWPCDCSTWRLNMASFVSIQVSSANATLVPWSVVSLDPSQRFLDLFSSIQAGKFSIIRTSSELSAAVLESVCIGSDKSNLSRVKKEGKDPHLLPK